MLRTHYDLASMESANGLFLNSLVHRRARQLGITMTEVAARAQCTRPYLYRLLKGETRDPSILLVSRLAKAIDVSPTILFREFTDIDNRANRFNSNKIQSTLNAADAVCFVEEHSQALTSIVTPNERFTKTWTLQNVGKVPWISRSLERIDDEYVVMKRNTTGKLVPVADIHLASVQRATAVPTTYPNQLAEISIDFIAPKENCSVASIWKMVDDRAENCFPTNFFLQAVVTVAS
jgi:transcriptional regulator with XRE-family HTH domain